MFSPNCFSVYSFVILAAIVSSCSNSGPIKHMDSVDSFIHQVDTIEINAALPFGCKQLRAIVYPKKWDSKPGTDGILKQPEGKTFEDITACFETTHALPVIQLPEVKKISYLKTGTENISGLDSLYLQSWDSCRYRLPDIGPYNCYYSYRQDMRPNTFGMYGNLLLVDTKTQQGKLLNIYHEGSGDSHIFMRFFTIEKNIIYLYEGSCYDDGCTLKESYHVTIEPDGKIDVKPVL